MPSRLEHFQALVARQPDNELFRFSLAQALEADDHGAEAVPHYEFCNSKRPEWMIPRILLGKRLIALGRKADGRSLLEQALQLAVQQQHEDPERELRALLSDF